MALSLLAAALAPGPVVAAPALPATELCPPLAVASLEATADHDLRPCLKRSSRGLICEPQRLAALTTVTPEADSARIGAADWPIKDVLGLPAPSPTGIYRPPRA